MTPSLHKCALALALGLALPLAAQAGALRIKVDPEARGLAVNPAVTAGYNFGNWMQMAEFGEQMGREVPAAALRFPGGNVGDENDLSGYMLDALVGNLSLLKQPAPASLMIQTRVFQSRNADETAKNRPEDAAEAVRLARARKLPVSTWEIGNEPDLFAVTRGDESWTAERYCEVFRAQAAAIRAEDPNAVIAGPAVSGAVPRATEFAEQFVKGCGDVVDLLTWHIYPTAGDMPEAQALASAREADLTLQHYRKLWADPVRNPLGHTRKIGFGVTEFGLSWKTDRATYLADMPGAMWAAETALRLAKGGASVAHYFAYQGVVFHGLLDTAGMPRPSFYGFRMLRALRGDFVAATSPDETLWAHAARDGNTLAVLLINTQKAAREVALDIPGWKARSASSFDAAIVDDEAAPTQTKPARTLTLKPQSMTLVKLERAASR
jgi:hypothetical protein